MKAFELPPMLSGTAEEQIDMLREYLMRLALSTEEEQIPTPVVNTQPEKTSGHGTSFGKAQLAKIYPVGSIYISVNEINPGTLFVGTWEQIKDTFLLAAGDSYAAGSTGGEAEHVLSGDELPKIQKKIFAGTGTNPLGYYNTNATASNSLAGLAINQGQILNTEPLGLGLAHNNMPPYLAVYVWQRVS